MATSNFSNGNRTIFVGNYDYNTGNLPEYDSKNIIDTNFIFNEVYIESGYYEGMKIDYRAKDSGDVMDYHLGSRIFSDCDSADECIENIHKYFDNFFMFYDDDEVAFHLCDVMVAYYDSIGKELTDELTQEESWGLETAWENKIQKLFEECSRKEEEAVNKYLDELRDEYQYSEYNRLGQFSSGETIYEDNTVSKRHAIVYDIESYLCNKYDPIGVKDFIQCHYFDLDGMSDDELKEENIEKMFRNFMGYSDDEENEER